MDNDLAMRNCASLLQIVKARELAHIAARDWSKNFNQYLKIGALISSTATTYLVNAHDESSEFSSVPERVLTFTTTIMTGLAAVLNGEAHTSKHSETVNAYAHLANIIDVKVQSDTCTADDFDHFSTLYRELRAPAPSLPGWTVKRYPEARKSLSELNLGWSDSRLLATT